eukprot:1247385-Amphidinium_carterae.1
MQIISSFDVLQQQLSVPSEEQKQKTQGYERTIAQRSKLHTVTEQAKYMFRFASESREHHERFQQRMRDEAKKM